MKFLRRHGDWVNTICLLVAAATIVFLSTTVGNVRATNIALGGGGTPGGSSGQVQYNNAGALGGVSGLNLTSGTLTTVDIGAADTTIARALAGGISVEGSRVVTTGTDMSGQTMSGALLWGANQIFNNDNYWGWGATSRRVFSTPATPDALVDETGHLSLSIHLINNGDHGSDPKNGPCGSSICTAAPTYILDPLTPNGTQYLGMAYYGFAGFALKALTDASSTSFLNIPVAPGVATGGTIDYSVFSTDGTDLQNRNGTVHFTAVNKAGTETCHVYGIDSAFTENPSETQDGSGTGALSTGTLVYTFGSSNSPTNKCAFSINANTSLTPTTHVIRYRVNMQGPGEPEPL